MTAGPRRVVAAFDLDGTVTTRDTLVPFLVRCFGRARVAAALLALAPAGLRVLCGRLPIDDFKCRVIARLFAGERVAPLRAVGAAHALRVRAWIRPAARERVRWHREQGHVVVVVSASLDLYLAHVAADLGVEHVLCTRLATRGAGADEVFDGALAGADCTGAEKLRRLHALVGDLDAIELHVYGDSAGDRDLLAAADHAHFRPFRRPGSGAAPR